MFDAGFRFRFQLGEKTEIFANIVADRVVALPEAPAIPPSPRDLIFLGAIRPLPHAFIGEHPYLDKRGEASFDAFIPGTATLGVTRTLVSGPTALGVSSALIIPMARSLYALRSGANSGSIDLALAGLVSREILGGRAHGRAGVTIAGKGAYPDRSFSSSGGTVQVVETDIPLGPRLDLGLGWIRPFSDTMAAGVEVRATKEFVGEERIDAISPVDVTLSLHKAFGRFKLSVALLNHRNSLPSGALRANPFAGAIDLSNVSVSDRNAFLVRVGAGSAVSQIRDGAHIVVLGASSTSLPEDARRIGATYTVRSEHNLGYIFTLSFRP